MTPHDVGVANGRQVVAGAGEVPCRANAVTKNRVSETGNEYGIEYA